MIFQYAIWKACRFPCRDLAKEPEKTVWIGKILIQAVFLILMLTLHQIGFILVNSWWNSI